MFEWVYKCRRKVGNRCVCHVQRSESFILGHRQPVISFVLLERPSTMSILIGKAFVLALVICSGVRLLAQGRSRFLFWSKTGSRWIWSPRLTSGSITSTPHSFRLPTHSERLYRREANKSSSYPDSYPVIRKHSGPRSTKVRCGSTSKST